MNSVSSFTTVHDIKYYFLLLPNLSLAQNNHDGAHNLIYMLSPFSLIRSSSIIRVLWTYFR